VQARLCIAVALMFYTQLPEVGLSHQTSLTTVTWQIFADLSTASVATDFSGLETVVNCGLSYYLKF